MVLLEHVSGVGDAELPLAAQTYFCDSRYVTCGAAPTPLNKFLTHSAPTPILRAAN